MDPKQVQSSLFLQALARTQPGQPQGARNHDCTVCSGLIDEMRRYDPSWQPSESESWAKNGVRYWSGTCAFHAAKEAEVRVSRAIANGESRDVAERKYARRRPPRAAE